MMVFQIHYFYLHEEKFDNESKLVEVFYCQLAHYLSKVILDIAKLLQH